MADFETGLQSLAARFGWSGRVTEAVRRQQVALHSHPEHAFRALRERFALGDEQCEAIRLIVGAESTPMATPSSDRTVWEESEVDVQLDAVAGALRRPLRAAPSILSIPAGQREAISWSEFCRSSPPLEVVLRRMNTVGSWVGGMHAENRFAGPLDGQSLWLCEGAPSFGDPSAARMVSYTAPEVLTSGASSSKGDVWSLGILLVEALTGVQWFHRVGQDATRRAILDDDRRRLPDHRRPTESMMAFISRCTDVDPERRPKDGDAFVKALQRAASEHDVEEVEVEPLFEAAAASLAAYHEALDARSSDQHERFDEARQARLHAERVERQQIRRARERAVDDEGRRALSILLRKAHQRGWSREQGNAHLLDELEMADTVGKHRTYIRGRGKLDLVTEPAGVQADLYTYEEREGRLHPEPLGTLGETPLRGINLPMGSYMLILRGPADVRYPVCVQRRTRWHGIPPNSQTPSVVVLRDTADVAVPAGWFQAGEDSRWVWCDSFEIQANPVSLRDYLAFLAALRKTGKVRQAKAFALVGGGPVVRWDDSDEPTVVPDADGRLFDRDGPVVGVPFEAAKQYARWRGALDGHTWRLPTQLEWEKAARGVDGRTYPWGNEIDARFAWHGRDLPGSMDAMPADSSPYGVRGMGGNVRDWVEAHAPRGFALSCGGAYADRASSLPSCRQHVASALGDPLVGFRLARSGSS